MIIKIILLIFSLMKEKLSFCYTSRKNNFFLHFILLYPFKSKITQTELLVHYSTTLNILNDRYLLLDRITVLYLNESNSKFNNEYSSGQK